MLVVGAFAAVIIAISELFGVDPEWMLAGIVVATVGWLLWHERRSTRPTLGHTGAGKPIHGGQEQIRLEPPAGSDETRLAVPDSAYSPERDAALRAAFAISGDTADLAETGFAPHEIAALKRDGLAFQDGSMCLGQWEAWLDERALRDLDATPTAASLSDPRFGVNNTLFKKNEVEQRIPSIRTKLDRLNVGVDPTLIPDICYFAGYCSEGGVKKFADFAKAMTDALGDAATPFLLHTYNYIRDVPGLDNRGMSSTEEVEEQFTQMLRAYLERPCPLGIGRYETERLYAAHHGTEAFNEIAQRIADGETPAEIADSPLGDTLTEPEIAALAEEMERMGGIPEPTKRGGRKSSSRASI